VPHPQYQQYHSGGRATKDGVSDFPSGNSHVKSFSRTLAGSQRRFAALAPALLIAISSCKKDTTSPLVPVRMVFSVQPTNVLADSSIVPAITVTLQDASGGTSTNAANGVTLGFANNAGGDGTFLSGSLTVAAIDGVATFPYLSVNTAATGYTLVATSTGLADITSAAFDVANETSGSFATVSAGGSSSCGVTTTGAGFCWGNNNSGQLGNLTTTNSKTPFAVTGGLTFQSVGTGGLQFFTCGLTTAGAAWCWGYNDYGQLGTGTTANSTKPVAVTGTLAFTSLSVGAGGHTCGLIAGGAAYCWGYNNAGQLGAATGAFSSSPVAVSGGLSFANLSAGESGETCGVTTTAVAYCWGNNANGQFGNGSTTNSGVPTPVSGGLAFANVSTGFVSSCGVTTGGAAYCWGDNTYGELGNGTTTSSTVPVAVSGGLTFSTVSVGYGFSCGLATSGAAYCWGYNGLGQLGNGTSTRSLAPVAVRGGIAFVSLSAGYGSSCALTAGGAMYCWGDNSSGQLGNNSTTIGLYPVLVVSPH
jgi:alpha-tubulin suppressor-like RCC1 family protein